MQHLDGLRQPIVDENVVVPVVILDLPFRRDQAALDQLMVDRTTIVVAHRLSTIRRADQILVVEAGRIVERGTHAQLYAARGRYYDLYTRQHGVEENLFLAPGEGDAVSADGNGTGVKNGVQKAGDALRVLRGEMR